MNIEKLRRGRILVTGSSGFLGRWLVKTLIGDYECQNVYAQRYTPPNNLFSIAPLPCYNLTSSTDLVDLFKEKGPFDYIFHVAGYNGGIGFQQYAADIFYRNTLMGLNLLFGAAVTKTKKVVSVVASCAYPEKELEEIGFDLFEIPRQVMREEGFLNGPPHQSVACHGYAKRNLQLASQFFKAQYGLNAVCVCPTTLYGPGDSFDPERTKVLGAMIARFVKAKQEGKESVTCWGSGKPMREFLYVEDAARLLVESMLHYENNEIPLNLGSGHEVSVKGLAEMVSAAVGYEGKIEWDTSKPDGQMRKRLDLTRMRETFDDNGILFDSSLAVLGVSPGFNLMPLDQGIQKTVDWYKKNAANLEQNNDKGR